MAQTHILDVENLSCAGCVARLERAVSTQKGVRAAQVNLATSKLTLDLEGPLQPVLATMEEAGYPAKDRSLSLPLNGASCASCVASIEARAQDVPGVLSAQMALATDTLHLRVSQGFDETALHSAFEQTKFELGQSDGAPEAEQDPLRTLQRNAALAAALTLPVVVLEMGGHLFPGFRSFLIFLFTQTGLWTLQAVLTTLVLAGPGRSLFVAGFRSLRHRAPDMNALVTLGAGAAFLYSLLALLAPDLLPDGSVHVYFEAAAVITTLILVGRWLEGRARNQAKGAIGALLALQPPLAEVIEGEQTVTRPVADLSLGTLVRLHPGSAVPVDGEVVAGRSEVDEALITGEPVPVPKAPGDPVIGGSLNGTGSLDVRVTALAGDSVLAKIAAQVEAAQASKLPVQHMVDRITAWFVPAVLALAAVTSLAWLVFGPGLSQAMVAAISVLIIACPCAMGLAVPVSILVGTGRGAEQGVLIRDGAALQRLAEVDVVAFDKTGTLTEGRPEVEQVIATASSSENEVLRLAAQVARGSEHVLAKAIAAHGGPGAVADQFVAHPGLGAEGMVEGDEVRIGQAGFVAPGEMAAPAQAAAETGAGLVYVSKAGTCIGVITLRDRLRPASARTIKGLVKEGREVVVLSGDTQSASEAILKDLPLTQISAGLSPSGKAEVLRGLADQGRSVAFVGDGINDAPALAAAEVGIAMGGGTDVAIEAADVVLMRADPLAAGAALQLGRRTMANIRQNLFWAFGYNVALIPVAAGVLSIFGGPLLSPMLAAGAMALSSLLVVSNALRLRQIPSWQG